ncbi:hypothetical protein COLO4_35496 [Corchorus olitorius]|uniref:Uncharacterized protein n=1 Tax=Corchorus olitorius TaxID=93759 RepID=A0A1R3GGD5_9ROSI|nr:hypothetical protein COLO4_35496 [Corchorus olitorius]
MGEFEREGKRERETARGEILILDPREREWRKLSKWRECIEKLERFQVLKDKHKEGMPSWLMSWRNFVAQALECI